MTELLAPAGSMEAFYAAILNGADAVYLGGKNFGARAFAENFDDSAMAEVIRVAHFHGKKVYVTVNTLLNDEEMIGALEYISQLYLLGVDAIILQDLGLLYRLRQIMPDLSLHASTQMTVNNSAAGEFVLSQGVKRLILARELSLADIAAIKRKTGAELEIFVHGALCICYSGQCLFSSMVGGRSGNRGRCAQPCRMSYTLVDEMGDPIATEIKGSYLLSPRDLVGFDHIEALHQLGVTSWKIEGRMKKPEYVATVTRIYSQYLRLLDENRVIYPTNEDMRQLLQVFNRDHGSGYWFGNPGGELMSFARPNNRGVFLGRIGQVGGGFIQIKLDQPLALGDGLDVWISSGGHEGFTVSKILVDGQGVEQAQPGDVVELPSKTGRVGDRVFKTYDAPLIAQAQASYAHMEEKRIDFTINAKKGQALEISAVDEDGMSAKTISEYIVSPARTSISDWYSVQAQLNRLGGSGFCFGSLDGEMDEDIMIPASVLNNCRRDLTAKLMQKHWLKSIPQALNRQALSQAKQESAPSRSRPINRPQLAVLVNNQEMALAAARQGIRDIYLDAEGFRGDAPLDELGLQQKLERQGCRLIPYLPQIIAEADLEKWQRKLAGWKALNLPAIVVNNPGQLVLAQQAGWQQELYAGSGMNIFNSSTARFLTAQGVSRIALSPELTLSQLQAMGDFRADKELLVQGAAQLMVSEYCAIGATLGGRTRERQCTAPCLHKKNLALRDEKGYAFPIRCDNDCRMHVFNSRELCLLTDIPQLTQAGISVLLLDLRLCPLPKANRLMELYRLALTDKWGQEEAGQKIGKLLEGEFTKGHLYRGV